MFRGWFIDPSLREVLIHPHGSRYNRGTYCLRWHKNDWTVHLVRSFSAKTEPQPPPTANSAPKFFWHLLRGGLSYACVSLFQVGLRSRPHGRIQSWKSLVFRHCGTHSNPSEWVNNGWYRDQCQISRRSIKCSSLLVTFHAVTFHACHATSRPGNRHDLRFFVACLCGNIPLFLGKVCICGANIPSSSIDCPMSITLWVLCNFCTADLQKAHVTYIYITENHIHIWVHIK